MVANTYRPTEEQLEVIEGHIDGQLQVNAFAGTGKTATLREFARRRSQESTLYLAFNKAMADEAREKFSGLPKVQCMTVHSLAFRAVGYKFKHRLGNIRPMDITDLASSVRGKNHYVTSKFMLEALAGYMSSDQHSVIDYLNSVDSNPGFDVNRVDPIRFQFAVEELWNKILNDDQFPFPHSAYLKLFQLEQPKICFDNLLVDEAQDTTDCMIDIIVRQRDSRRLLIGDSFQQIYSWNGAVDSLKKLAHLGETKYLTKSFRCPEYIAEIADKYLQVLGAEKHFKGAETHGEGPAARISRTTGHVFARAVEVLNDPRGKRSHFLGGFDSYNFGLLLDIWSLKSGQPSEIREPFLKCFENFDELAEYAEVDQELSSKVKIVDKVGGSVRGLYFKLKAESCDRKNADYVLSTAHRAKGQEFGVVQLSNDFVSLRNEIAELEDQENSGGEVIPVGIAQEELNLLYVAMTRAKKILDCPEHYAMRDSDVANVQQRIKKGHLVITNSKC